MQIEELPCELIINILSYLPITDLKNFSTTSKLCLDISRDPSLWKKAALLVSTNSREIFTLIQSTRFKFTQNIKIDLNLKILNELVQKVLSTTSIKHLYLYTTPLNRLLEEPGEEEIIILRSTLDDLIRGIHFSKLRGYFGPKYPPSYIHIPFRISHPNPPKLQQITINEAGISRGQLLEFLRALHSKEYDILINLESTSYLLSRTPDTITTGLAKILYGLSARLSSLCTIYGELGTLKIKQTCTVYTLDSIHTFSYKAKNGLVPCLNIFSTLLNIKSKIDLAEFSVAGLETNAILLRVQDQAYDYL